MADLLQQQKMTVCLPYYAKLAKKDNLACWGHGFLGLQRRKRSKLRKVSFSRYSCAIVKNEAPSIILLCCVLSACLSFHFVCATSPFAGNKMEKEVGAKFDFSVQRKLVRSPYQTCAEMLSLLRTHTEPLKWTSNARNQWEKQSERGCVGSARSLGREPQAPGPRAPSF